MDYDDLQIFIPAFMVVFIGTLSVWAYIRKNRSIPRMSAWIRKISPEIRLVGIFFRGLLALSLVLVVVYAFFPEYYYLAGPIDWLDDPVINTVGLLVLKISLVWIVTAQFNIERTMTLIDSMEQQAASKLISSSQKLVLTGMLIMFFGLFITLSSVAAIFICAFAGILFGRLRKVSV